MKTSDLLTDALREIGVINAVDAPSGEDAALALNRFNRILDRWNANRQAVYADQFLTFTLTPGLNPHTIGPTGTFVVTQRPQTITAATIVSGTSRLSLHLRDAEWFSHLANRTITADSPSDLYYEPAWPNGNVWLFGVPGAANSIELLTRVVLGQLQLNDTFSLPPGYWDALVLSLAEALVGPFQVALPQALPSMAREARALIFGANARVPRIATRDSGMTSGRRGSYDYGSGLNSTSEFGVN